MEGFALDAIIALAATALGLGGYHRFMGRNRKDVSMPDENLRHHHLFNRKDATGIYSCACGDRYLDGKPRKH